MNLERNMSKVILHLGLPKTATTLLQMYAFNQTPDLIDYAGVRHPRNSKQDPLYTAIVNCINNDETVFQSTKQNVITLINERLSLLGEKKLIISEECFSLDSKFCSWQKKMARLGELFSSLPLQILITTREPVSALYSYYVELYSYVKKSKLTVVDFAMHENKSLIYDYKYLDKVISESFLGSEAVYIPFELLKEQRLISEVNNKLQLKLNTDYELPKVNIKKKNASGVWSKGKSLSEVIRKNYIVSGLAKHQVAKMVFRPLRDLLQRVRVPFSSEHIPSLSSEEKNKLIEFYYESNKHLKYLTRHFYE